MYQNSFYKIRIFDSLDYFLISTLIGSLIVKPVKKHLSEKAKMNILRQSILSKSRIMTLSNEHLSYSEKVKKIQSVALARFF